MLTIWLTTVCCTAFAQLPDTGLSPSLRHDPGGPDSVVKALQFAPDGQTLYVAGWNKVVQVYRSSDPTSPFQYTPRENFRVPVGTGRFGMIEAMALSPDGQQLAVAGPGWSISVDALLKAGYVWPRSAADQQIWDDVGTIYVYDTDTRQCQTLRGHRGDVRQLSFAEAAGSKGPSDRLVSVGFEYAGEQISQSVRAWSLDQQTQLGTPLTLPNSNLPPRIRAWSDSQNQLQVAVGQSVFTASGVSSTLQLWTPQQAGSARALTVSPALFALETTATANTRQLFAGSAGSADVFNVTTINRATRQAVTGMPAAATPMAATAIAAATGSPRVAFVTIQSTPDGDLEYWLNLLEGNRARVVGRLWTNRKEPGQAAARLREPELAASADGRLLAIAGADTNDVRIYNTADLPDGPGQGDLNPIQVLASETVVPGFAVFATNGTDTGIAVGLGHQARAVGGLNSGQPLPNGVRILDPATRTMVSSSPDWTVAAAEFSTLRGQVSEDRTTLLVSSGGTVGTRSIQVPAAFRAPDVKAEITAWTLVPPQGQNPPLAVVATHIQGEPFLNVFRADSGEFLRELTGHVWRITHLSASRDGRLLLSTSVDGTVRGWLLGDLHDTTIGSVGWLNGLQVTEDNNRLVVEPVAAGSPAAAAGLQAGDVILGIVRQQELVTFSKPAEFYLHVSRTPATAVPQLRLRINRNGRDLETAVPVSQGADIRQPLFSLLLHQPLAAAAVADPVSQWLVWNPFGQFDLSGAELEQRLGWHLNTNDAAEPVVYSSIDQYREQFFTEGLLQQLLTGDEVVLQPAAAPQILLSLLGDAGQVAVPNYDNDLVVRQPGGTLLLEFPENSGQMIRSAEWQIDGQPAQSFVPVRGDLWESRISPDQLPRGYKFLRVRLLTADQPPREISRKFGIRYQPPAPTLLLQEPAHNLTTVDDPQLPLNVSVDVAVPGIVTLVHRFGDNQTTEQTRMFAAPGEFATNITLQPGSNTLQLTARNGGIPDDLTDFAFLEEASLEMAVNYLPVQAPSITIDQVVMTDTGQQAALNNSVIDTDHSQITVRGTIRSSQPLQAATLDHNQQQTSLSGFQAGQLTEFEFAQSLQLRPGADQLKFTASAGGEPAELLLDVNFRPPLPQVSVLSPVLQRTQLDAVRDPHSLPLQVRLENTAGDYPFDYQVLVDGLPVDSAQLSYDSQTRLLSGTVSLVPDSSQETDDHRIQLRLTNQWQRELTHPLVVEFQHPPKVLNVDVSRIGNSALAQLNVLVQTAATREVTGLSVMVNGTAVPIQDLQADHTDPTQAEISVDSVPLTAGDNRIQVTAINRDGDSLPLMITEHVPLPPKPARVTLWPSSRQIASGDVPVRVTVESESELQQVLLVVRHDQGSVQRISLLDEQPAEDAAETVRTFQYPLQLPSGISSVRVEVVNRGGLSRAASTFAYPRPPVSVHVAELEPLNRQSPAVKPVIRDRQILFEQAVPFGRATLRGFIAWPTGIKPAAGNWTVRVWVNGFLRTTSVSVDQGARRAEFEMPVVLSQRSNRVRLEATVNNLTQPINDSNLALAEGIRVNSSNPETRQRLHLVLMGVQMEGDRNVADAKQLRDLAEGALLQQTPGSQLETAFQDIQLHPALTGDNALGRHLRTVIEDVERDLRLQRGNLQSNDVVLFYYRGREHRHDDGNFVLEDFANRSIVNNPQTRGRAFQDTQSITGDYLSGLFKRLPGAHVVFLDVENPVQATYVSGRYGHDWPNFPNLGLFRVSYSGQQPGISNPPGPLLTAVRVASSAPNPDGIVELGRMAESVRTYLAKSERLAVDTVVPVDLSSLALARVVTAAEQP